MPAVTDPRPLLERRLFVRRLLEDSIICLTKALTFCFTASILCFLGDDFTYLRFRLSRRHLGY